MAQFDARQCSQHLFDHGPGAGRSPIGQAFEAAQVIAGERRMGQQREDHGGHQQRFGHPLALNGLQHLLGIEGRYQHMAFTGQELDQRPRHAGNMEQRRHVQQHAARNRRHVHGAWYARRPEILVRLHHALGKARGSAGIEDASKVVIATPGVIDGRRVL
ncbi:hypothetical protein D9M71_370100 [compost metagenome]